MTKQCCNCKYADVADGDRVIETNGMRIIQKGGGIKCTHTHIKSLTMTDGEMICSEYEERK